MAARIVGVWAPIESILIMINRFCLSLWVKSISRMETGPENRITMDQEPSLPLVYKDGVVDHFFVADDVELTADKFLFSIHNCCKQLQEWELKLLSCTIRLEIFIFSSDSFEIPFDGDDLKKLNNTQWDLQVVISHVDQQRTESGSVSKP